ncbi:MAG: putative TldD/pmbA family protein [Candidatus Bathyarchaeota archaeon B63]|nr:MAG: putative TldD/pmbA family protein [Candidatus Bathyarchaeota archaeon B63]
MTGLIDAAELAVKECLGLGADEAEGFVQRQRVVEIVLERGEIQNERTKTQRGIGVRVIMGRRLGFAFASSIDEQTVHKVCRDACKLARVSPENPDWVSLPLPREVPPAPMGLYDEDLASLSPAEVLSMAISGYDAVREVDPRVSIDDGKLSVAVNEVAISNSHGISLGGKATGIIFYLVCIAKEAGESSSFAYEYQASRTLRGFSTAKVGELSARKALMSLGARRVKPFQGDVILSPDVAAEVLFGPVISSVNADNVQRGRSLWAGKIGEAVSDRKLTVTDDGLLPYGLGSSPFDGEGVPSQRTKLIDGGVLKGFLYDSYTANKAKVESTGNAFRGGYSGLPSISISNLLVEPGTKSLDDLVSEVEKGIIINRFSGRVTAESGEFSGVAKQASYIEDGEIRFPLKETMISGNAFESLRRIVRIGRERRATMMRVYTPPILVEDVKIVSK